MSLFKDNMFLLIQDQLILGSHLHIGTLPLFDTHLRLTFLVSGSIFSDKHLLAHFPESSPGSGRGVRVDLELR